jgi:hypothetical protein
VAIGDGLFVEYGARARTPPSGAFHITYRTWLARFDLYGDGTADADIGDESAQTGSVRYSIAPSEVTALARQLRALKVWTANRPVVQPEDVYLANFDIVMDGRRAVAIKGEAKAMALIARTVRADVLRHHLQYRLDLLDAAGFHCDSQAGADFALAVASDPTYGDADIERLLSRRVPCQGGRYERALMPPMQGPQPLSLQEALVKGGHIRQARRLAPPPAPPHTPQTTPILWQTFPDAGDLHANYPPRATDSEVEGEVKLRCRVSVTGRLAACQVEQEKPAGFGFGTATVKLLQAKARAKIGTFQPGAYVDIGVHWQLN